MTAPPSSQTSKSVFVGGLPIHYTDLELQEHFEEVGPVLRAFVIRDRKTKESKGAGIVEFSLDSDAQEAIRQLHNAKLPGGGTLRVRLAEDRKTIRKQQQKKKKEEEEKQEAPASLPFPPRRRTASSAGAESEPLQDGRAVAFLNLKGLPEGTTEEDLKEELQRRLKMKAFKDAVRRRQAELAAASEDDEDGDAGPEEGKKPKQRRRKSPKRKGSKKKKLDLTVLDFIMFPSPESLPGHPAARVVFHTKELALAAPQILRTPPKKENETWLLRSFIYQPLKMPAARLIVRNLSFHTPATHVKRLFARYGPVDHVNLPTTKGPDGREKSKGFGFVQMAMLQSAKAAVDGISGKRVSFEKGRPKFISVKEHGMKGRVLAVDWSIAKDEYQQRLAAATASEAEEMEDDPDDDSDGQGEEASADEGESDSADDSDHDDDDDDGEEGDSDEEQDSDDEEDDSDTAGMEDDDDQGDQDVQERNGEERARRRSDVDEGATIFIRNLAYTTTDESLRAKFSEFGAVRTAKIVVDRVTGRPRGTGFVQFWDRKVADDVLARFPPLPDTRVYSVTTGLLMEQDEPLTAGPDATAVKLDGRILNLTRAVRREQAEKLTTTEKKKRDKRNLYLAHEGWIAEGTPAAKGLAPADLEARRKYRKIKLERLRNNPNICVSPVRLSVRNLPRDMDEALLKKIFVDAITTQLKASGGDSEQQQQQQQQERPNRKIRIGVKQVKIVRDKERKAGDSHSSSSRDGLGRSKRFGFIEFRKHEHALIGLRAVNNNPKIFPEEKRYGEDGELINSGRPIVEFALDDRRILLMRESRLKKDKEKQEQNEQALAVAAGEVDSVAWKAGPDGKHGSGGGGGGGGGRMTGQKRKRKESTKSDSKQKKRKQDGGKAGKAGKGGGKSGRKKPDKGKGKGRKGGGKKRR